MTCHLEKLYREPASIHPNSVPGWQKPRRTRLATRTHSCLKYRDRELVASPGNAYEIIPPGR